MSREIQPGETNMSEPAQIVVDQASGRATGRHLPFANLGRQGWLNLGLSALAVYYLLISAFYILQLGLFRNVAGDFRAFWSAAEIARDIGFSRIYDLPLLALYQRPIFEMHPALGPELTFEVIPVPYLPVFIALFTPLLPLGPTWGFVVWTLVDLALISLYFVRLGLTWRRGASATLRLPLLLLSWPVFLTLFFGQVNILLLVGVGEFLISLRSKRLLPAGLWLGLLLLKPQMLVVVLLGLLLARQKNVLIGFAAAALVAVGASAYLLGLDGIKDLAGLISQYVVGMPSNTPQHMMNWRGLGENLAGLVPTEVRWVLVIGGMALTLAGALLLWWRGGFESERRFAALALATLAATNLVAWHAHMHMGLAIVPALLFAVTRGVLPAWLATVWLLLPAFVMGFALLSLSNPLGLFTALGLNLNNPMGYAALCMFGLTVLLEMWAIWAFFRAPSPVAAEAASLAPVSEGEITPDAAS